jgi:hypothetical protein
MAPAHGQESEKGCNIRRKGLKTLTDPQRKLVNLHPTNTTAAAINALAQPHPTPKTRSTDFSRRVWRVTAQITEFKLEGDSDIHLVLFDENAYLIAEMPAAQCLPKKTRDRKAIIAARKKFEASCGKPTNKWKELGAWRSSVASVSSRFLTRRSRTPGTSRSCIRSRRSSSCQAVAHNLALIAVAQGAALTACAAIRRPARGEGWGKHRRPWA